MNPSQEHPHLVRSEEDRIDTPRILAVGVAALVVFFIGSLGAIGYYRMRQARHVGPPIPAEVGQNKIGMVEQQLFELAVRGERDRAARLRAARLVRLGGPRRPASCTCPSTRRCRWS